MDYSLSESSSEENDGYDPLPIVIISNVFLCIVTVVGNFMVITAYIRDDKIRQTVAYTLILNLSITDILVGIFIFPLNTLWWINEDWTLGPVACKLWLVLDYSVLMMSTFTIVFISLDRYWLLTKGLDYQRFQTFRQVLVILSSLWFVTVFLYLFIAFAIPIIIKDATFDSTDCELEVSESKWFNFFEMVVQFIIPFTALVFLNYKVYSNIRQRSKGLVRMEAESSDSAAGLNDAGQSPSVVSSTPNAEKYAYANDTIELKEKDRLSFTSVSFTSLDNDHVNGLTNCTEHGKEKSPMIKTVSYSPVVTEVDSKLTDDLNDDGQRVHAKMEPPVTKGRRKSQARREKSEFKRHRKAAITLGFLVGVFFVCWLPYYICAIIRAFWGDGISSRVWEIVSYFQWCNSTINPFIYGLTNILFRRNFVKFLHIEKCIKTSHLMSSASH